MNKILKILLQNKNQFISGTTLGSQLGISRAAINKSIKKLQLEGHQILTSTKKGYCYLNHDLLIEQEIFERLNYPHTIKVLDEIDSTNTYLKQNPLENHVIVARNQTQGRGRQNRLFYSEKDTGLYFSFMIKPNCSIFESLKYTLLSSVAVLLALQKLYQINIDLKWVNDLYLNNKKIGGILCEGEIEINSSQLNYLVVGIGINLSTSHFPSELSNIATSIQNETNIKIDRNDLLVEIINIFDHYYHNQIDFMDIYKKHSSVLHQEITVFHNHTSYHAYVKDILDNGSLLIIKDGKEFELNSAEITIRKL